MAAMPGESSCWPRLIGRRLWILRCGGRGALTRKLRSVCRRPMNAPTFLGGGHTPLPQQIAVVNNTTQID